MEGITIPAIMMTVYILAELFKAITKGKASRYIPPLCGIIGALLAVALWAFVPETIGNVPITTAILNGIISGLSATGTHEIISQIRSMDNGDSE